MKLRRKPKNTGRERRRPRESAPAVPAYRSQRPEAGVGRSREQALEREIQAAAPPRPRPGKFLLNRFGLIVLLLALLFSSVKVLSLSANARIVPLPGDSGSSLLQADSVYQTAASKLLADSIWNRNKITVNTTKVSHSLLKQFPELSDVSVTLPLLSKRPVVYLEAAQPALVLATQQGSFVIDSTGKALIKADMLSSTSKALPVVTDQSGIKVSLNHQALTSGDVGFIQMVVAQLATRNFKVSAMELPVGTSELDVHLEGQPYIVKFNLQSGSARQQAGTFMATALKLQSQGITPGQYVDVRVDGRSYYK